MPIPFYLSCLTILALLGVAWQARWRGWGLPMGMVLATTSAWYLGDAYYNDYEGYEATLGSPALEMAWWQVFLFVLSFGAFVPGLHRVVNKRFLRGKSHAMAYIERQRSRNRLVQRRLDKVAVGLFAAWGILTLIALIQVKGDFLGLFAPYLGRKVDPWSRGQIGGGFSALISLASYLQIFLVAAIGVVAALSRNPKTRNLALLICVLAFPNYIFDRTRNTLLATVLPGLLAFVLTRLRLGWGGKIAVLGGAFLILNAWMLVISETREGMSFNINRAIANFGESGNDADSGHAGLNMFEELAWVEVLTKTGRFRPETGERYFAELVNPVPRALWKNKPTIGLDYAVARGQSVRSADGSTTATISTGMIGQGVVNFGPLFGPVAAAFLMALWVVVLARQDLLGNDPGRMILYGCGLILTFNLARDITVITLYPFLFGLLAYLCWQYLQRGQVGSAPGKGTPVAGRRSRSKPNPATPKENRSSSSSRRRPSASSRR